MSGGGMLGWHRGSCASAAHILQGLSLGLQSQYFLGLRTSYSLHQLTCDWRCLRGGLASNLIWKVEGW